MFGLSFSEFIVIAVVALVAVGPKRLPGMLHTMGQWVRKLRKMTTEVRAQTGIDDILRAEGLQGGLNELRTLVRGQHPVPETRRHEDPYANLELDLSREYPPEGPDAYGALADDLLDQSSDDASSAGPVVTAAGGSAVP
ncbi:MAG TPA: Sec-independent protein translocase protein TatB [Polyangiaceae bacterium]|nr:Sec-independent protein translocase protein TatB [Polyangiaceae bacterium]